jgi:beta-glucosidase
LYYNDLFASIAPAVKKLCAYSKIELQAGETKTVEFVINKKDFSFINKNLQRVTEPGDIELMIHSLKKTIHVQ